MSFQSYNSKDVVIKNQKYFGIAWTRKDKGWKAFLFQPYVCLYQLITPTQTAGFFMKRCNLGPFKWGGTIHLGELPEVRK